MSWADRAPPHDMGNRESFAERCMISVVIPTHESERALANTLAALVPGAIDGVLREVIVADAGSRDGTAKVADVAGCRFMVAPGGRGRRPGGGGRRGAVALAVVRAARLRPRLALDRGARALHPGLRIGVTIA